MYIVQFVVYAWLMDVNKFGYDWSHAKWDIEPMIEVGQRTKKLKLHVL